MSKIIGVDMDSTLNKINVKWLKLYNAEYNDHLTIQGITQWDMHKIVKPECGLKIYDYLTQPGFFRDLGVMEHSQEVTEWILSQGGEIHVVTAYYPEVVMDKVNWLKEHFPHIPTKNIVFCNHKGLFKGDVLIDDGGHNIEDFSRTNPDGLPILLSNPWNYYLGNKYPRAGCWLQVKDYLKDYFKGVVVK